MDVTTETLNGIEAMLGEKRLEKYSDYLHGARMMLAYLCDKGFVNVCNDIAKAQGHDVYEKAVERLILGSMGATHKFMLGAEIKFSEHKRNEKGKLVSVSAEFGNLLKR